MFGKHQQQLEFTVGQRDHDVVRRAQFAPHHIQSPAGELQGRTGMAQLTDRRFAGPAQHGPHPCQQFTGGKRFGQVVVCPQLQAHHPVTQLAHGGEHDHRHLVLGQ
ncbi:hypothetical protein D3C79_884120 [compost metagenome]